MSACFTDIIDIFFSYKVLYQATDDSRIWPATHKGPPPTCVLKCSPFLHEGSAALLPRKPHLNLNNSASFYFSGSKQQGVWGCIGNWNRGDREGRYSGHKWHGSTASSPGPPAGSWRPLPHGRIWGFQSGSWNSGRLKRGKRSFNSLSDEHERFTVL